MENYIIDMQLAYVYLESVSKQNHLPYLHANIKDGIH
jgi:hypothetical protein